MSGYYDDENYHRCGFCNERTVYQSFSGGREFWCDRCETDGRYPDGDGGPRARLLNQPDGHLKLRRMMYDEISRRKEMEP